MKVEQLYGPTIKPLQVIELEQLIQTDSADIFCPYGLQKQGVVIVTCAPARLDIMGGIADYCGANVLEMTLNRTAVAACQARKDRKLSALTLNGWGKLKRSFQISLDDFYAERTLKCYTEIQKLFGQNLMTSWTGYVLGGFYTLLKEGKIKQFPHGASIVLKSDIPMGAGLASSAAIEIAALMAINQLYNLDLGPMEIARLAQIVENRIVGAPCGIMDQITSVAGTEAEMLSILCQPDKILETIPCPPHVSFVGINTKAPRSTASTAYIDTRTAAFMGLTILQKELGWKKLKQNYLCKLSVQEFHEHCEPLLPEQIQGEEFLKKYGETVDTVTQVDPQKVYPIKERVTHPIYENARVTQFIAAMKSATQTPERVIDYIRIAGKLMYESNDSYKNLAGLGSPEVDGLISIAQKIGEQGGIYGAKITGGGEGGTVAILCYGNVSNALIQILAAYKLSWGLDAEIFRDSAPGAYEFGHLQWELKDSEPPTHF